MNDSSATNLRALTLSAVLLLLSTLAVPPGLAQDTSPPAAEPTVRLAPLAEPSNAQSVAPGINSNFLDPNLDVQEWVERFEVESREVYHAREEVLKRLDLQAGERVADIGAGTGFYALLMADEVGQQGWVFAVEISPRFAEHLAGQFAQRSVGQATTVLCDAKSVRLPPASIDKAFICDVYHHFEYPHETMGSLFKAMRPGGRLFVIDFERIPGVSREWTLSHVRAGKETFIEEIEGVGFELVREHEIADFEENYFLEFRKGA